jgi:hypothetical protein
MLCKVPTSRTERIYRVEEPIIVRLRVSGGRRWAEVSREMGQRNQRDAIIQRDRALSVYRTTHIRRVCMCVCVCVGNVLCGGGKDF